MGCMVTDRRVASPAAIVSAGGAIRSLQHGGGGGAGGAAFETLAVGIRAASALQAHGRLRSVLVVPLGTRQAARRCIALTCSHAQPMQSANWQSRNK